MADSSRVMLFTRRDAFIGELDPDTVFERTRTEEINGEHSLTVTTTAKLEKGMRVLTCDETGKWREYVVVGVDELHDNGDTPIGTYFCEWSLKHDLLLTVVDAMPGTRTPVTAGVALAAALEGTSRWAVGTVTQNTSGGASMYYMSGWEALGVVVETWGGEIDADIGIDTKEGVISRSVSLYAAQGEQTVKRRFDYSHDLMGIRRKVSDEPVPCRILPRGKGEETESGGYGRKVTIESVNSGKNYLQNDDAAAAYRVPDGSGGWEYPTIIVENGDMETPADLKAWAESVLEGYTTPKVTYEADVMQLSQAGMDVQGIALGDAVQCVDREFGTDGLRIQGRVVRLVTNELDPSDNQVTIGYVSEGLSGRFSDARRVAQAVRNMNGGTLTTADYLNSLLQRLNGEINATGGYTYITEGQGIRTYDAAVSDPLVGTEASAVVEIKGGTIRIANSKTSQGEWNWKTVFTSGHIAANMVTAANITAGYIGSPSGNYWNLDTGEFTMATTAKVGNQTLADYIQQYAAEIDPDDIVLSQQQVFNALTNNGQLPGIFMQNGQLYVNASYLKTGIITDNVGKNYWNLSTGQFKLSPSTKVIDSNDNETNLWNYLTLAQTADTKATTAKTTADSALTASKSQVGGTNLLVDTNEKALTKKAADANRYWSDNASATKSFVALTAANRPVGGVTQAIQMAIPASKNGKVAGICYYNGKCVKLINGQQYTVSCWAKRSNGSAAVKFQYGQTSYKASADLALTTGWKRYSWTFTFSQTSAGGSDGARIYFFGKATSNTATTVQICGMKLEVGAKATDWSQAPEDVNYGVTNATALAKTYTNTVSATDRQYSKEQRQALDESFNQGKVFNRLTNNGQSKGIVLKNGQLYINGTYIQTDTLNAGIIKTGILTDKKGLNKWNMATGYFYTKSGELENCNVKGALSSGSSNKTQFNNGTVRFFNGNKNALTIDGALKFSDGNYGAHFTFPKYMVLRGPDLAVDDRTNGNGLIGASFTLQLMVPTASGAYGYKRATNTSYQPSKLNPGRWNPQNPVWKTITLTFINGICVSGSI